ncbi:TonB-dependent receptor [Sphingomonas sp. KR1UV-12]|uniref:TonB-dependent receptor n=1 Tax=Sphingomonas aurea TaxID=3063994 RepID=A0ABT9ENQ2_9SPHN|nr:TonB-dependent receptor [Sphingomonas sp. KR1UV-12]MDP1028587.1 TonB-dependent receptor [Sphingomonas sp. KR1UV-12]
MNKTVFRAALIAATTLAAGAMLAPVAATAQVGQASLRGRITSPTSNAATEVSAIEVATNYRRTVPIAADGTYNFASLRAGTYRLEVKLQNGTRNSDEFTLRVGQNAGLDIDLTTAPTQPAEATEETTPGGTAQGEGGDIIVTGSRIRSLAGGQVGINITQRLIEQLPQNNRNFLAFADLAPGVRFVEGEGGQARIQGGAQDSRTVNVFIDGVSQKDYVLKNGITGQDSTPGNPFPQLAIGEYQVLSSNYKAEFDQVSSVAITATTKSGTNAFHGEGFIDYTDQKLRARRPTEIYPTKIDKVTTTNKQFGGALGGPIVKDVAHFFVSYEGKRIDSPYDVRPDNGVLPSSLPSQLQQYYGTFSQRFNEDLYFGKIDIVPTDADLIEFTGKYRNESGVQIGTGIAAAETATANRVKEWRGMARWQHTADNWINDARLSYEDVSWFPSPITDGNASLYRTTQINGTATSTFNLLRIGGGGNFQDKGQKGWTFQDDFTWTGIERHTIKVGGKAKWVRLNSVQQNLSNPLFSYDTTLGGGFNTTLPYRLEFGAAIGDADPAIRSNNFQFGIYAQDDWDVTDRLTLNIGLRWDYERTPAYLDYVPSAAQVAAVSSINYPNLNNADYDINDYISNGSNRKTFKGAFQPRLGFTYRFDEAGRFSMFGGYGRSYDRNQFDFLQQELAQGAYATRVFNFIGNDTQNPCTAGSTCIAWDPVYLTPEGRQRLLAGTSGGGRELRFINNDLKVPYSDQFSLGLRGRFSPVELEVGYTHIESKDGFVYLLGNRRPDGSFFYNDPASATDVPNSPFNFTPPGFNSIIIGSNGLETSSDAAYVKLTKTYSAASPWSLDATYTYTEATENRQFGETFSLDYPSINDYPVLRSSGVPRHRFVAAGSVDTPIGVTLSAKFQIESPLYQKAFINSAVPFERVLIGGFRDSLGDIWGRRQLDVAVTKYIPLGFITDDTRIRLRVDIINLMNDRNYVDFNNNPADNVRDAGSPTVYGERVGYSIGGNQPRTIKLSAGFSF